MADADDNTGEANNPGTTPDKTPDGTSGQSSEAAPPAPAKKAPAKKAAKKTPAKKAAKKAPAKRAAAAPDQPDQPGAAPSDGAEPAKKAAKKAARPRKAAAKTGAAPELAGATGTESGGDAGPAAPAAPMVLFKAPEKSAAPARKRAAKAAPKPDASERSEDRRDDEREDGREDGREDQGGSGSDSETPGKPARKTQKRPAKKTASSDAPAEQAADQAADHASEAKGASGRSDGGQDSDDSDDGEGGAKRRPRRRGGRRRRKGGGEGSDDNNGSDEGSDNDGGSERSDKGGKGDKDDDRGDSGEGGGSRRRRRRRRPGEDSDGSGDDPQNTVTRVRKTRNPEDEITSLQGSTRLAAKKQRRQEGREAGRRRAPIVSEAEFLARRESVDRVMVIRQRDDLTQIGVLEDKVLVEHYVARDSQTSLIGNVYLGRVQNVLPSMEAAFIDIGKGRNAVLYAGEVNWSGLGHKDGAPRKIESVLKSGQPILVQVTKDPIGHKGARLTSQVSLPGRFLVYVPDGNTSGISRKLPDTERNRLKTLLKEIVPDTAGVIVRTAAEGASEEELTQDVERLTARWSDIEKKVEAGKAPELLYGEPDLTLKVVRDLFTEDFAKLVVQGEAAWDLVDGYVSHVAPDLRERLERYEPNENGAKGGVDLFTTYRVDEQIAKGLDRKVWLPSGGSLVIDRTEAMTVVDVNTGKFTGSGGNLEETVTKNNLEAAEEIVRQLRLRDIGGIIVVDFIDMVLEVNRDLVLRRMVECLGRDRTRHQVAEVTSLGLVQMTRKRIGTGLLEAFSEDCEHCKGRGVITHEHPVEPSSKGGDDDSRNRGGRGRGGRNRKGGGDQGNNGSNNGGNNGGDKDLSTPSPKVLAGTRPHPEDEALPDTRTEPAGEPETAAVVEDIAPEPAAEPEPPRVVTTRRRTARRPAGQPEAAPESEQQTPVSVPDVPDVPAETEAAAVAETPVEAAQPAAEPEPPRVVTSTRRRTARRPAGPPSEALEADPGDPEGTVNDDDESGPSVAHVPVKRKGSRKR